MKLQKYIKKRNVKNRQRRVLEHAEILSNDDKIHKISKRFKKTKEPKGKAGKGKGNIYVIQQHFASKLHYDLRLEIDGVLKSWAVTKEPIEDPAVKRLAIQTEDHPLEYGSFEGTIPEGQYGAGDVIIWDKGTYKLNEMTDKKIIFTIKGEKLKGTWCLIDFKPQEKMWLLFKKKEDIK